MKPNINKSKNIAYIQNIGLLTNEQIQKYMGDIKYLTSDDPIIIYRFIVCLNKCYKITKFCLMINSEILRDLNILIKKKKKLNKCIFFATRSNANSVRNVIAKNIYFSLSSLSVVLKGFLNIPSNYVMTIVSDANTPYYNQIYNTGPKPVYRISELTVKKVNAFVNKGTASDMLIALNEFPINEFAKLNKILLDPACKYKNFATFIELSSTNIPFIEKLKVKLARINNISSNVSLCGVTDAYPDIDSCTLYQNSAIQFVNFYNEWCEFIKHYIVFNRCTPFPNRIDYGSVYCPITPVVPTTYTVTYNGNTNTSGNAPVDGSSPYIAGSTVTVLGNTGTPVLVKTGYTFNNWNTAANGSGTSYSPTSTFIINANTTLYAQWTPIPPTTYTVAYNGNTNTSGTAPVDGSSPYTAGSTVTVLGNTGVPVLAKTGYTFAGWNTAADGSGTSYSPTSTFTINANTTLYAQWTPIPPTTYTVTYNGNTNTSGNAPVDGSSPYTDGSTVTVLGNTGTPVLEKTGFDFAGWNTAADGSGTPYSPTDTFPINANTTLYAQWTPIPPTTYTVTYNGNTNTSGNAPVDGSSPYTDGSTVTVLGNTGTPVLEKTGFDFAGWNTAADGSGTPYSPTDTFPINANTTLYAQWTPIPPTTYTVTYNGNTNTSGNVPVDGSSPYTDGSTVTVLGNTGTPVLEKTGFDFAGWNTAADGSGTSYSPTDTFPINANTTLYAQWTPEPTYTVTYNGNTNTSGNVPVDGSSPYIAGSTVTVLGNTGTPVLAKTGNTFAGWNTAADGSGTSYSPTSTFPINANTTLYAQWTPDTSTYTVTYNGNTNTSGNVPVDGSSPYTDGSTVTVLGNTGTPVLEKTGYTFNNWNTAADGSGTSYSPTSTFPINANTTLYAQWTPVVPTTYTVTYNGNTNTSGNPPVDGSSPYTAGSTVTVLGNTGTPVLAKTGNTFAGWNTAANGTGTSYSPTSTFPINANTILYAQWTPVVPTTYTVTYNGNTNTSGNAPVDGSSPYAAGSTVTVFGNTGSPVLAKTGYQFAGWNTAADGSGTSYVGGNTFAINANTTLYAQWIIGVARLLYNANSAAGGIGTAPSSSGTYYTAFSTQPVVNNTGPFTNTNGYTFGGWNTSADGSGTSYPVGSNVTMPGSGTFILYAQWINPTITNTLTYNAGTGGSGTAPNNPNPTNYSSNTTATILNNTGSYTNSDPTKIFYGWNTAADGTGTSYPAGSTLTMNTSKILYAQWVSNTSPYTVTYDANGATGGSVPAAPTNYPVGVQVSILGQGSLTNPGYVFLGWNGSPTGAGSLYAPGYTFTSKTATLYALWAPGSTIKNCGGGTTSGGSGLAAITYIFPFSQIIQSANTITVYTTALLGTTSSNYGSGAAPLGIISIASKTVVTQTTIQINVNTSYSNPANDYNYAQTITNGSGVTYWPSGATISSITYATQSLSNSAGTPTYSISTSNTFNGCGLTASSSTSGITTATYSFFNQSFTINFSDSTSTFIANSPNNAFYASNNTIPTWSTIPRTSYPYALIVPKADNSLTTITIIPSTGSKYVSPLLPNYTVEYNGNGNTSGTPPIPQYMDPYISGTTSITLRTNSGVLAKTGSTFSGWNTAADGTGTSYAVSATYNGTASLTLYAKWV